MRLAGVVAFILASVVGLAQGPYSPGADKAGSDAISASAINISGWATSVTLDRGPQDIAVPMSPLAAVGIEAHAEGAVDRQIISLGDGGSAIVSFDHPIVNKTGPDFAVFENGFIFNSDKYFLELAFVEVSMDSVTWFRFPPHSLTDTAVQINNGLDDGIDPTNINGLAGKYVSSFGTPFDIQDIIGSTTLYLDSIRFIKIIDVVGSIDSTYATRDSQGNIINDPYPTEFTSSGFDLDAVAVINWAGPPASILEKREQNGVSFLQMPCRPCFVKSSSNTIQSVRLLDLAGRQVKASFNGNQLDCNSCVTGGLYQAQFVSTAKTSVRPVIFK